MFHPICNARRMAPLRRESSLARISCGRAIKVTIAAVTPWVDCRKRRRRKREHDRRMRARNGWVTAYNIWRPDFVTRDTDGNNGYNALETAQHPLTPANALWQTMPAVIRYLAFIYVDFSLTFTVRRCFSGFKVILFTLFTELSRSLITFLNH